MGLVKVIPLGGCGEIGKNCTVVEDEDGLIVIDVGLSFPHEEHYGVDIVVPDFTYLVENQDRVRGVFLTHAHEDHVGALSFLLPHVQAPIHCTPFTNAMVRSKLEERAGLREADIKVVRPGDTIDLGSLKVEFVRVTHSIPETCALAVHTTHGAILFTTDFKFDFTPVDGKLTDVGRLTELGREGVLLLLSDSTNIDRQGWGPSESRASEGLGHAVRQAPGRVLVTMFSSNIHRMQQCVDAAVANGRKVAVTGRRMEATIDICRRLGYLTVPDGAYIRLEDVGKYRPNEILLLVTGSQGEPMAALSQMSRGEYSRLQIVPGDTVLYSARPIPGNEGAIWRTVNRLVLQGARVVTESDSPIHISGHAYQEEIKMMVSLTQPFYIAPVHGEPRHQDLFRRLALAMGWPEHRVFTLANGDILNIDETKAWVEGRAPSGEVLIDQHGNAAVTPKVLAERSALGQEGVVVVSLGIDTKEGAVTARPEAHARGYSGPEAAIEDALDDLVDALARLVPTDLRDTGCVERLVTEVVGQTIARRCRQRPVVLPVLVEA